MDSNLSYRQSPLYLRLGSWYHRPLKILQAPDLFRVISTQSIANTKPRLSKIKNITLIAYLVALVEERKKSIVDHAKRINKVCKEKDNKGEINNELIKASEGS